MLARSASFAMIPDFAHSLHDRLLWVNDETFAKMAATDQKTGLHKDIPVISLESLLAMKLHALENDEERKGRDLLDIRYLLGENPRAITDERLRELCERYAGPDAYNLIRMGS